MEYCLHRLVVPLVLCVFCGCKQDHLSDILAAAGPPVTEVLNHAGAYEVQIIYVQIDRDADNNPEFTEYRFRADPDEYFYPASTVKMPVAALALEKLHELSIPPLDRNARMRIDSVRPPQSQVLLDTTSETGLPSIGHCIHRVFMISDNEANNMLYEFLGQQELNDRLRRHGLNSTRILHRLSAPEFSVEDNRYTNPLTFYHQDTLIYRQEELYAPEYLDQKPPRHQRKGKGYADDDGKIISEPFDFSSKNFFPLHEQVQVLKAIFFPSSLPESQRFCLDPEDLLFLRKEMGMLPRESVYPRYDTSEYYDGYAKFFLTGDNHASMPDDIRVFNKAGWAYGYMTDCAYIADFAHQVEFILAATILVNKNRIFNDGQYEFDEVGKPFLAELGRTILTYERERPRKRPPDLSEFEELFDESPLHVQ